MMMMIAPAQSNSLADLAARIQSEHQGAQTAIRRGIQHAITAGELLVEAKEQLGHGQWLPWLKDHCGLSERTARRYMQLAKNRDRLAAKNGHVADLTLRGALDAVTQHLPKEEPETLPPRPLLPGELELPIDAVKFRHDLYPRSEVMWAYVEDLTFFLRDLPAIVVNQRHELIDGWHRWEAHRQAGANTIRVGVVKVNDDIDHLERACAANSKHGAPLPLKVQKKQKQERDRAELLALRIEQGRQSD